jgi:hypothetical protein
MAYSPLVLPAEIFPDMSADDIANEIKLMHERSTAIHRAMDGNMPVSELAELVRSQGFDIDQWAADCELFGEKWE